MMKLNVDEEVRSFDFVVPPISLKEELAKLCIINEKIEDFGFRGCRRDIWRSLSFLAVKFERRRSDIERMAAGLGVKYLFGIPGISKIRQARQYVFKHSGNDSEYTRSFDGRFFDLGTSDVRRYHGRLLESDVAQIAGLGDILGLDAGVICQMSFTYALLHSDDIPVSTHNGLAELFRKFCGEVREWADQAQRISREVGYKVKYQNSPMDDYWIPLAEVLPPKEDRLIKRGRNGWDEDNSWEVE